MHMRAADMGYDIGQHGKTGDRLNRMGRRRRMGRHDGQNPAEAQQAGQAAHGHELHITVKKQNVPDAVFFRKAAYMTCGCSYDRLAILWIGH
ncbi:hypothetical protein AA11826_1437 [Komagataeibacter oboediens DSM 11826]|nr:hypothetical protein AA11826_1437 [Komagataeibacter oboediens DSM 11826]